jgi:hypothetical protein
MIRRRLAVTALCFAVSLPIAQKVLADDLMLTGFPSIVLSGGSAKAQAHPMREPFDATLKAGTLDVTLEKTTLDDVVTAFGGKMHTRGDKEASVSWVCYEVEIDNHYTREWFIADGGTGVGKHVVTTLAGDQSDEAMSGCKAGPKELANLKLRIPALNKTNKDLEAAFGAAVSNGIIRYAHAGPPEQDGKVKLQSLVYRLKDGQITGVALVQHTSPR